MKDVVFHLNALKDAIIHKYELMGLTEFDLEETNCDYRGDWDQGIVLDLSTLKEEIDKFNTLYAEHGTKIKSVHLVIIPSILIGIRSFLTSIIEDMGRLALNQRSFHAIELAKYDLVRHDYTRISYDAFGFDYFDFIENFQINVEEIMTSSTQDAGDAIVGPQGNYSWQYHFGCDLELLIKDCHLLGDFKRQDDEYKMSYMLFRIRYRLFLLARTVNAMIEDAAESFFILADNNDD
ncbi:hypothetical protein M2R47_09185 [Moraxella sp. Tifton1]|uniref:hypothetical protein n=1 Tax=Moraxella oculi TaxID=2940516 RepID=UPI002010FF5C|nr:hypothetical protein [Moraxella sp. Tifton1]MCL1624399.1 hypothetical protein [Moraxella sp. Tifton1]